MDKKFLIIALLLLVPAFAVTINGVELTADDIFVTLIENTDQCLINCHAIYEIHNPTASPLVIDTLTHTIHDRVGFVKPTEKPEMFIEKTEIKYYKEFIRTDNCTILGLDENDDPITDPPGCKITGYYKQTPYTVTSWVPFTEGTIPPLSKQVIKITYVKEVDENVEWIPHLYGLKQTKWAWWNSSWSKCQNITIQAPTGPLDNYPLFVNITYDSDMQTDFDDIRFVNDGCGCSGTELSADLEKKQDSVYAETWVELDSWTASMNISIYYGNGGVADNWDPINAYTDFDTVWYLNETQNTDDALDAVQSMVLNQDNTPDVVDGRIDGARDFNDVNSENFDAAVDMGLNGDLDGNITMCFWYHSAEGIARGDVIHTDVAATQNKKIGVKNNHRQAADNSWEFYMRNDAAGSTEVYSDANATWFDDNWHAVCWFKSGQTSNDVDLYVDNVNQTLNTHVNTLGGVDFTPDRSYFGCSNFGGDLNYWDGVLDTVWITTEQGGADYADAFFRNLDSYSDFVVLGPEESPVAVDSVSISYPANTTYYQRGIEVYYTAINNNDAFFDCYAYYEGESEASNKVNTTNATLTMMPTYTYSAVGQQNVTIECENSVTGNFTDTAYFTLLDYGVTYNGYETTAYETSNQTFWMEVNTSEAVLWTNTSLWYNDNEYTTNDAQFIGTSGSYGVWNFTTWLQTDLIFVNETNHTFFFDLNVTYTNSSSELFNDTQTNQTMWESFYFTSVSVSNYYPLQGETVTIVGTVTKVLNNGVFVGYLDYNATNNTGSTTTNSSTQYVFTVLLVMPTVVAETNYTVIPYANVSWNPTKVMNFTPFNLTVSPINITENCTYPFLIFNSTEEETEAWGPFIDLDVSVLLYSGGTQQRINRTFTGNNTYCLQLEPTWAVILSDVECQYSNTTNEYATRNYYLDQVTLSNETQYVTLYTELDANTTLITFNIKDLNDIDQANITVSALRYFVSGDLNPQYKTVAMCKSDEKGECTMELRKDFVWYTFNLASNGTILNTYDRIYLIEDSLTLRTAEEVYGVWQYNGTLGRTCTVTYVDGSSTLVACTVSDTTNVVQTWRLRASQDFALGNLTVCNETLSAAAGVLTCNVTDLSGIYSWRLTVDIDENNDGIIDYLLLESGSLNWIDNPQYSTGGLLAAIFIVIATTTFASFSPAILPWGPVIGIGISWLLKLIYFRYDLMIGLILMAALVSYKVKT